MTSTFMLRAGVAASNGWWTLRRTPDEREARRYRLHMCPDPLRAPATDAEPITPEPGLNATGCVLLLLAVAFGVVAGYLLGVTQ